MRIGIVTPAPPRSRYGNRVTAVRWAKILRTLGHRVSISQQYQKEPFDLLIALHARRSHQSIKRFKRDHPEKPIIVALTGTDLYHDLHRNKAAQQSLQIATRIVALQPKAPDELEASLRRKVRIIYQSVHTSSRQKLKEWSSSATPFPVCVIGHLRAVKDPFRAAVAARLLPSWSRIRVIQIGGAMNALMERRAREEMRTNRRYRWLGELPQWRVHQRLSGCAVCVVASKMEGGANVVSEAIAVGVPVLASNIPGNVGILGQDYRGYFNVGDSKGLAQLLLQAETNARFLKLLRRQEKNLAPLFKPARERAAWARLLKEIPQKINPQKRGFSQAGRKA